LPNLELGSWDMVGFDGAVFDWRDQTGYADAFAALTQHLGISSLAVEGQVMRVFVHHAFKQAQPDLTITDAEREISALRMIKTPEDIVALRAAARSLGVTLEEPFLQLAFLALPVIPALKITDRGLVDVVKFEIIP